MARAIEVQLKLNQNIPRDTQVRDDNYHTQMSEQYIHV
jgi:hypothetical protein